MAQTINRAKQIGFLRSLCSINRVMMEQGALMNFQRIILENARQRRSAEDIFDDDSFRAPFLHELRSYNKQGAQTRQQYFSEDLEVMDVAEDGSLVLAAASEQLPDDGENQDGEGQEVEDRVIVLRCQGPVTRGGGMCSYGSMDFRNIMQEYAGDESVKGLVFLTDTPGGDAMSMYDFKDGMDAWKAAGKRSIQLVDGICYSAGEAMGCQCDYQIAVNAHDGFGCIGTMTSGWLTPNNTVTRDGERYIHVVASQTPDKNLMWQKAAEGDTAEVEEWVSATAQDFLDTMTVNRPGVKAEHLTGKIYDAFEVMGSLCDGIGTMEDAIHYCLTGEKAWQMPEAQIEEPATVIEPEPEEPLQDPEESDDANAQESALTQDELNQFNSTDMALLERIAAALGVPTDAEAAAQQAQQAQEQAPEVNNEPQAGAVSLEEMEAVRQQLTEVQGQMTEVQAQLATAQEQVTTITAERDSLQSQMGENRSLLEQAQTELQSLQSQLTQSQEELATAQASLTEAQRSLAEAQQQVETLTAENTELRNTAPAAASPAPAPEAEEQAPEAPEYHEGMTAQELIEWQKAQDASRGRK